MKVKEYRDNPGVPPATMKAWPLYGSGLENLGADGKPVTIPVPQPGPDELLARVDAAGLCFSDIKVLNLGNQHPRIFGRDLAKAPVILGHECALTIVSVGANRRGSFRPGDRFIVQADIYFNGVNLAFGYALPGALEQYVLIGKEILDGDEGCYLLPVKATTGYSESALSEPWACVVASYRASHRDTILAGGRLWIAGGPAAGNLSPALRLSRGLDAESHPRLVVLSDVPAALADRLAAQAEAAGAQVVRTGPLASLDPAALSQEQTGGAGFDDIILLGADAALVEKTEPALAKSGIINLVGAAAGDAFGTIDIGRVHYDYLVHVGTTGDDIAAAYAEKRSAELVTGGTAWFAGAGGPMGQMHVQRAAEKPDGPALIVATDVDGERLAVVAERFGPLAEKRGARLVAINPKEMTPQQFDDALKQLNGGKGFDDVVVLVPVPAVIGHCATHVADNGVLNIFAGVAKGTMGKLPVLDAARRGVRFVGTSGSRIADMRSTLSAAEAGTLNTNRAVAAIGGIEAAHEGLGAVKGGRFPGKIVIYPQIEGLPLTSLAELADRLPAVAAKLGPAGEWTREAEETLLETKLPDAPAGSPKPRACRRLEGKTAIVTGAAQGLGAALAERLAAEGCSVGITDINEAKLEEVAARIRKEYGVQVLTSRMDVTDDDNVGAVVGRMAGEFGRLDVMVCNAGILIAGGATEFKASDWRKVVDVNLVGYFICARHAARIMEQQRFGSIIQINSKSGKKGSFKNSAYAASKFGGIGLTQSLAMEMAPFNVRVNAICPGNLLDSPLWVDSLYEQYARRLNLTVEEVRRRYIDQVPLGRGCAYEDVANVVVFLASEESSYMTGQAINVTGGQEMR